MQTTKNMETTTIKGIEYNIIAVEAIEKGEPIKRINPSVDAFVILQRPKGSKQFWGMRFTDGRIELN